MAQPLAREIQRYEENVGAWLPDHEGEWVLVHGEDDVMFFKSEWDAATAGYEKFGDVSFLIRRVLHEQPVRGLPFLHSD